MSNVLHARTDVVKVETGLSADDRRNLTTHLSAILADTMFLTIKSQVYHWNVVGPLFKPIHELTEEHYRNLFEASDVIAERIRALGHPAPMSVTDLIPKTNVEEETAPRSAKEMVNQLISDHEEMVRRIRSSAESAEEQKDFVTHDLLTSRLDFHEKAIWMLRAIVADE